MTITDSRTRWLALYVLCLASLMIVLDVTIVNVALPSIRDDLGFTETSLAWVVNAYLLPFGGFLLLGGRLGALYGQAPLFLRGSIGVLLGGVLTDALSWHWIFLVNVPIGALVYVLTLRLLPPSQAAATRG